MKTIECRNWYFSRHDGISVVYDGLGRIRNIHVEPSQCPNLIQGTEDVKKLNLPLLQKGISAAILDAHDKVKIYFTVILLSCLFITNRWIGLVM